MQDDAEARRIFQDMLDRCGEAMLAGDMAGVLRWFTIPNTVESFEGRRVLGTVEETRDLFRTIMARQRELSITHMIRKVTHAEFRDADTIRATHETRYIHHGTVLSEAPHVGLSILHRYPDCWKVHHAQFTVAGRNPLNSAIQRVPGSSDGPISRRV
ncbi:MULTISPECIES: hypothetical protein [Mameliella]|uniref:SnoaL-like domain-containing protein n=1 Tax=Mameliella alba TaxID=561184 RepID=A0A0B3SV22_9RHOB|nr:MULTISPECIES: hypothetical protein [Mameliella]MCR9273481.1 hypothetical protein [Paracoccaceae bacterium]ODM48352.1 hypothetical protein A9320_19060 [Ruegeria sp. PBVC088]KHQ54299.1 hypothetical protein OA50_00891 [Mameliella alba]MDD9732936.1 hypothetical protein [Mameliella sp. AT18]OWV54957.1 hypothetical protein CDZ98_20170 [Mameliella alba]